MPSDPKEKLGVADDAGVVEDENEKPPANSDELVDGWNEGTDEDEDEEERAVTKDWLEADGAESNSCMCFCRC